MSERERKSAWSEYAKIVGIVVAAIFSGKSYYTSDDTNVKVEVLSQRFEDMRRASDRSEVKFDSYTDKNDKEIADIRKQMSEIAASYYYRQGPIR